MIRAPHGLCRVFGAAGLLLCGVAGAGRTQTLYTPAMTAALQTPVHLRLGKTTLGAAMQALSQQTGQTVECADYLNEHRLTLHIEDATAQDALNQLADLIHCKWTEAGAKHILFARARPVLPEHPLQIPAALQTILPPDLQRYIGIAQPDDLWLTQEQKAANVKNTRFFISRQIQEHASAVRENLETNVWTPAAASLMFGSKYLYDSWTPAQRQAAVLALFTNSIETLNNPGMVATMNNQYDVYERDPMLTVIHFKRDPTNKDTSKNRYEGADMLWLGAQAVINGGYYTQGFAVNLKMLTDPPFEQLIPLDSVR